MTKYVKLEGKISLNFKKEWSNELRSAIYINY